VRSVRREPGLSEAREELPTPTLPHSATKGRSKESELASVAAARTLSRVTSAGKARVERLGIHLAAHRSQKSSTASEFRTAGSGALE